MQKNPTIRKIELISLLQISGLGALLLAVFMMNTGCSPNAPQQIKRVGMVVGMDPGQIVEYKRLHADGNPEVRDILRKYRMRNFSIFLQQMSDGK